MKHSLAQQLRTVRDVLRWRGPVRFLLLVVREVLRPFMYWYVYDIFDRDLRQPIPESYARGEFEIRIYKGSEDLERHESELASMGELPPVEIKTRFGRGDIVAVAYDGQKAAGYLWLTFSSGMELGLGTSWIVHSHEAVRYGMFVLPQWRGRGISSFLNHAVNVYGREHGIIRTLASISVLNNSSLSLPKHFGKAPSMKLIIFRVRGVSWTYRKAIGAPFDSRFSKSVKWPEPSYVDSFDIDKPRRT